jgi:RNA polymerase sigma-70 factor (ECF subfamily)
MHDLTLADVERLRAEAADADVALQMDEDAFRAFYDRTARVLRAYLSRVTGDAHLADDLLQETYYRFLRARSGYAGEAHRRNALFRIATNLVRDNQRRASRQPLRAPMEPAAIAGTVPDPAAAERAADLRQAMARLKPRERELLWLAYAQGSSHREIAAFLGLKTGSVKLLLFRARRRLAGLLRAAIAPGRPGAVGDRGPQGGRR